MFLLQLTASIVLLLTSQRLSCLSYTNKILRCCPSNRCDLVLSESRQISWNGVLSNQETLNIFFSWLVKVISVLTVRSYYNIVIFLLITDCSPHRQRMSPPRSPLHMKCCIVEIIASQDVNFLFLLLLLTEALIKEKRKQPPSLHLIGYFDMAPVFSKLTTC